MIFYNLNQMTKNRNFKLPKEFTTKWLEALRSGKYKQGIGFLYNKETDCYCPIGIAGKLCEIDLDTLNLKRIFDLIPSNRTDTVKVNDLFPKELAYYNDFDHNELPVTIASFNDGRFKQKQLSFPEIADWIEANVKLY